VVFDIAVQLIRILAKMCVGSVSRGTQASDVGNFAWVDPGAGGAAEGGSPPEGPDDVFTGRVLSRQTCSVHVALLNAVLGDLFVMGSASWRHQARLIVLQVRVAVAGKNPPLPPGPLTHPSSPPS
jgi:hypothetical protein